MDLNLINTSWCYHSIKSMGLIWERNWQWGRAVCTNFEFYCVICLRSTANRLLHLFEIFDLYQPCSKSLEKCTFRCHRLHCAYCANRYYSLGADCVGDHIVYFVDLQVVCEYRLSTPCRLNFFAMPVTFYPSLELSEMAIDWWPIFGPNTHLNE